MKDLRGDLVEEVLVALNSVLAEQQGTGALVTYRKLVRAGLRVRLPVMVNPVLEQLLIQGIQDPLGRGVWRLRYVRRNGNRKRYYLSLQKSGAEDGGGGDG